MAGKALIDYVLRKLLSKKLSRKRGIETIAGPEQQTVLDIQSKQLFNDMSNAGFDMNMIKENDVMYFLNLKKQKMDEVIKSKSDELGLGEGLPNLSRMDKITEASKNLDKVMKEVEKNPGIEDIFKGWTPKVVEKKTIPVTIKGEKTRESPRGILDILLGKKRKAGDTVAIAEEIKLAYPKIQLTGKETFAELKEMLKRLDEEDIPFQSGGLAYLLGEPDYMKAEGGRVGLMYGGDPGFAFEYGGSWADWQDKHKHAMPIEDYVKTKMPKERLPFRHLEPADSLGYDEGGKVKKLLGKGLTRRTFLGGLLSLLATPFMKFGGKEAAVKATPKVVAAVANSNAAGKPPWLDLLIARVIREGDDLTAKTATSPQQTVHRATLPESGTPVEVTHDLTTGSTIVDIGEQAKHGWESGRYGQPSRLVLKKGEWIEPDVLKPGAKGTKTKDEFFVEEAEFTGGHPENVKFEESVDFKYGEHGSDFSEIEKYATGKNVDKKVRGKQAERDAWAEGHAEAQAEAQAVDDFDPEFASGGIAHLLGE